MGCLLYMLGIVLVHVLAVTKYSPRTFGLSNRWWEKAQCFLVCALDKHQQKISVPSGEISDRRSARHPASDRVFGQRCPSSRFRYWEVPLSLSALFIVKVWDLGSNTITLPLFFLFIGLISGFENLTTGKNRSSFKGNGTKIEEESIDC